MNEEALEEFLSVKRLEGRSEKTLFLYKFNIGKKIRLWGRMKNIAI